MRRGIVFAATVVLAVAVSAATPSFAQTVSDELAASLAAATPQPVIASMIADDDLALLDNPLSQMRGHGRGGGPFSGNMGYRELHFPSDSSTYVLVYWLTRDHLVYWRLFSSTGANGFSAIQDSQVFYGLSAFRNIWFATADLDMDGVPEVLLQEGGTDAVTGLFVFAWRGCQLSLITPLFSFPVSHAGAHRNPVILETDIHSTDNAVVLQDLDGDGKAEIIAYPDLSLKKVTNDDGREEKIPTPVSATRIFKLDSTGVYILWKEVPAGEPLPVTVPSIAVVHPGTIPLSELANSKGGGDLRVFVSHPVGTTYTVDDFVTTSFALEATGTALGFNKRWDNQRFPDLSMGNREWMGVPVRQEARAKQGEWNVNPSDPAYPSPDAGMEFHFLGPYLELRVSKSALFPYLLERATAEFAKDPTKNAVFIEVSISGKMKDGKLAAVGGIACVRKTAD